MKAGPKQTLIGRESEAEQIRSFLGAAQEGQGGLLLLSGPAGIGKSRLISASLDEAVRLGFVVAATTNFANVQSPFGPVADLARELAGSLPEFVPKATADRALFDRLVGATESSSTQDWDKRRLFVVLASALERVSLKKAVALAIDDAQWIDPESLEFLAYLTPRLETRRVFLLLGLREGESDPPGAVDVSAKLARFAQTVSIRLEPLGNFASRELVLAALSKKRPPPKSLVDEICRRGEGNPLFIEEMARHATEQETSALPRSVQQSLRRRLVQLDSTSLRIIEVAAILGRVFTIDDLERAAATERAAVIGALRAGRDAGLIEEVGAGGETFAFRHELVRAAVYEQLLAAERKAVHRRVAEYLETFPVTTGAAAVLAHHWAGAGDAARVVRYAEHAGDEALALSAAASARDRFLQALEQVTDDATRARLDEKAGTALDLLGDAKMSFERLQRALTFQREVGNEADAVRIELRLAGVAYRCGRVDEAIAASKRAIDSPASTPHQSFAAHVSLATFYAYGGDVKAADHEIALADAYVGAREPVDQIRLDWARAMSAQHSDDPDRWLPAATNALRIAEERGPVATLAYSLATFFTMADENGRYDLAEPALERCVSVSDANGLTFAAVFARSMMIAELHFHGRLAEAYRLLRETLALQVEGLIARISLATNGLSLLNDLGRLNEFPELSEPELLAAAFETHEPERVAPLAAAHVQLAINKGDREGGRALIARALDMIKSPHYILAALYTFALYGQDVDVTRAQTLLHAARPTGKAKLYGALVDAIAAKTQEDNSAGLLWEKAAELAREMRAPLLEAAALEGMGSKRLALAIYGTIGADAHVSRLGPRKTATLSRREAEIAELITRGESNRSIAEILVLSERTVEHHSASIYAKSGVKTRAAFIAQRRRPS